MRIIVVNDVSDDKGRVYKKKITLLDFCNTIKDLDFSKIELSRLPQCRENTKSISVSVNNSNISFSRP